jgi:hypothetical protein
MQARTSGLGIAVVLTLIGFALVGCGESKGKVAKSEASVIPTEATVDLNEVRDPKAPIPMRYTQDFQLEGCTLESEGNSPYYDLLKPGATEVSYKPDEDFRKRYVVLKETKRMDLEGLGKFEAAIVEEREFEKGVLRQISLNWYVVCKETNSVFSVGEVSKQLNPDGTVHDTEGSWQAGLVNDRGEVAIPAMQVPGTPSLGSRYIFDGAPGVALGGAETVAQGLKTVDGKLTTVRTKYYEGESDIPIPITKSLGDLKDCIQVEEISQISESGKPDIGDATNKVWCPGVGLVYDTSDGALIESNRNDEE